MTNPEVLRRIEQASAESWTELDIRGLDLAELPPELATLTQLEVLKLGRKEETWRRNNLRELPAWMADLVNLQSLDLSYNNLRELPVWMAQLVNLHSLDLSANKLRELPASMAQLVNLQSFYLSGNKLRELPEWIADLVNLQSFYLSGNKLRELPGSMAQLVNLHSLDLCYNNLRELPAWMADLVNLQSLDLSYNNLRELPAWMAQLVNLQSLDLSYNNLRELPEWMGRLTHLQSLDLRGNNLSELPAWMAQLVNLQSLDLNSNNLRELPAWMAQLVNLQSLDLRGNKLRELPAWMGDDSALPLLDTFRIGGNPITEPPAEVLGNALTNEYVHADLDAIRSYSRQILEEGQTWFYEAKLLIIGEGGAGKTSLARKLVEPTCDLLLDEASTEGVEILDWHFDLPEPQHHADHYTANIWDFGGQEIYFATHQFFLTRRSVYLLVADTRQQHTDFYTWLRMQETFGESSPVLAG